MDRLVLFSIVAVGAGCRTSADCDAGVTFCDGYTGVCWSCSFVELLVPTGLETQSSCPHHAVIVRTSHRTTPISKGPFQTPIFFKPPNFSATPPHSGRLWPCLASATITLIGCDGDITPKSLSPPRRHASLHFAIPGVFFPFCILWSLTGRASR